MSEQPRFVEGYKAIAELVGRCERTVRTWARRRINPLPVFRVGGVNRLNIPDYDRWLSALRAAAPTDRVDVSDWWPPQRGFELLRFTHKHTAEPCVVVIQTRHEGTELIVVAERVESRWFYEVVRKMQAELGEYWPAGREHPLEHRRALLSVRGVEVGAD